MDTEFGGEMQVDVYSGLLPFRGVVVCATGSVDKVGVYWTILLCPTLNA